MAGATVWGISLVSEGQPRYQGGDPLGGIALGPGIACEWTSSVIVTELSPSRFNTIFTHHSCSQLAHDGTTPDGIGRHQTTQDDT